MAKLMFLFFLIGFLDLSIATHHNHPEQQEETRNVVHNHDVPKIQLNDGNWMPVIGVGTSVKGGSKPQEVQHNVEAAIDIGYRFIDTAETYETEDQVGAAVHNKIQQGVISREDMFITTKLWNDHHRKDLVVPALKESLKKLGMDYVDLYLIHWPVEDFKNFTFGETDYLETWEGMEECKRLGLAKSIGLSNFNEHQIDRLLKVAQIKPAAIELEVNPNLTQRKLVRYCRTNTIEVIAFAPLGSLPVAKKNDKSPPPRLDDPILTAIGHKYNKNPVQVVLRYLVERSIIPIPKSSSAERLHQNIDIFDFSLTLDEVHQIDEFNLDKRIIDVPEWKTHKYYPF